MSVGKRFFKDNSEVILNFPYLKIIFYKEDRAHKKAQTLMLHIRYYLCCFYNKFSSINLIAKKFTKYLSKIQ